MDSLCLNLTVTIFSQCFKLKSFVSFWTSKNDPTNNRELINPFVYVTFEMIFERGMAVRRDQLMQDELKRMHMQHKAGFAILTGHNLQDTSGSTYRW